MQRQLHARHQHGVLPKKFPDTVQTWPPCGRETFSCVQQAPTERLITFPFSPSSFPLEQTGGLIVRSVCSLRSINGVIEAHPYGLFKYFSARLSWLNIQSAAITRAIRPCHYRDWSGMVVGGGELSQTSIKLIQSSLFLTTATVVAGGERQNDYHHLGLNLNENSQLTF